ncbi:V-type ATP synthase subunit I [Mangrovibacterium diazotrophicum]|nr:hypothetical protein [Mangrovibacterium diazotrophicum]
MKKLLLFMANTGTPVDVQLADLGRLGLLHIVPFQPPRDQSIELISSQLQEVAKALEVLERVSEEQAVAVTSVGTQAEHDAEQCLKQVLEADDKRTKLLQAKSNLEAELQWYEQWGNVAPSSFQELNAHGVYLRLYEASEKELKKLSDRDDVHVLGEANGLQQVALITEQAEETLPLNEVKAPEKDRSELENTLADTVAELENTERELTGLAAEKARLQNAQQSWLERLDLLHVAYGGESLEGQVNYWKGYIPEKQIDALTEAADQNGWGYVIEDTTDEDVDEVPTLIYTSRWGDRIRPVMNFMGLVPGYNELDVSHVFMLFFTFFTGILVGDAGYGLVFFLLTLFAHKKAGFKRKVEFQLMYTLSVSILFWGVLTGTYFGSETVANIPFLAKLRVDKLASFGGDNVFVQRFMFFVGAIHLTVGHLQQAIRYINSLKALAQLGWISITWGLYFIVNQMVLQIPAPDYMLWLFVGGALLVALFSSSGKSFFKGILSSVGNLPLSIINGFSDIISYVRLYAVGLSTVLMASSFNDMAIGDGLTTVLAGLGAVIILILGHGLNMALAAMAVLVHGVRLNMLEYAGHADVEFSGSEYNPFKINK